MATTRIMPLHVGKGRTESRAISDIIDYVANPQKTDNGRLIAGFACDSRTVDAEFLLAKRQYIAATGRVRGADDVIAYHDKLDRLELPALVLYIRHDFWYVKSGRQKRPSHHVYRFCYSGSLPAYILLSSP